MKKIFYSLAAVAALTLSSCSDNDNEVEVYQFNWNSAATDNNTYASEAAQKAASDFTTDDYKDKKFGNAAVSSCTDLVSRLENANGQVLKAQLTTEQEEYLRDVLSNLVDNVIIPTYTKLADATERLESTLNGLDVNTLTQAAIDKACEDFATARIQWERSEAFLGGAASEFDIDPTIDSWPLSRSKLLNYFKNGMKDEDLDDESILGFHALEFILFRNGAPRKVAEFQTNDTYKDFGDISGANELKYAQRVCTLLKERTFQLQVSWEGETTANATRVKVVKDADLEYTTKLGKSFGYNMKNAGNTGSSTFDSLKEAVAKVLSDEEGSAAAIANEVGTAKIARPFSEGTISYVESPYSYRSITDFMDNIRSVRNVWYGTIDGTKSTSNKSFYSFFLKADNSVNNYIINKFVEAINNIGGMPCPFVKYCCTIWNKEFDEEEYEEEEE